jgi:hypothetical protein
VAGQPLFLFTAYKKGRPMTKPKPKALGSTIDVPEGAQVVRPGGTEADARTITGGVYVLDAIGTHVIDGREVEVVDDPDAAAAQV